jgi:hypothetical protein
MKKHHAVIARSGIQYYLADELASLMLHEIPREYKNQKVFSVYRPSHVLEGAKEMFKNAPIRVDHKWLYTQSDPAIIGHISDEVDIKRYKGEVALCSILNIDNDDNLPEYNELSPGYLSDNKWQPGVAPNGEPYEILCTKINCINHLAIVHEARGGKDMKILDGGNNMKKIIHSGLIRAIKKRLTGVMDGTDNQSFESVVDEIGSTLQNIDDEGLKAKTASLVGYCDDLPDSDEKEKLLRYIADIPLLKDEDKEVAEEALKCIKESYNTLDSDANSEIMEKPMEEEKKEQTPAQAPAQDEVPAPAPAPAESQNEEAPAEEKKEDGCGGDGMAKLADALDAISKKLDSLLEAKAEPKADEKPVEEPKADEKPVEEEKKEDEKPVEGVSDSASLPQYTQSLSAVNAGYSLDDAFAKLKGRR